MDAAPFGEEIREPEAYSYHLRGHIEIKDIKFGVGYEIVTEIYNLLDTGKLREMIVSEISCALAKAIVEWRKPPKDLDPLKGAGSAHLSG